MSGIFYTNFVDLAMTGEITLRGVVLPVGGIKEKVIAAHITGIKTILLPERNRKDLKDVPDHVKVLICLQILMKFLNVVLYV